MADDVAVAGLDLLPGAGEVQPRCSCPDWADPCKHAAAVCYLVADAFDADPFALLRLRGRERDDVLAGLRARRGSGGGDGGLGLDEAADLARRGAALLGRSGFAELAAVAGVSGRSLARDAIAWRHGGSGGLAVLHDSWQPDAAALDEGRDALPGARVWRNRLTSGAEQLRLGEDGLWYRLVRSGGDWDLDGPPDPDPAALVPADLDRSTV